MRRRQFLNASAAGVSLGGLKSLAENSLSSAPAPRVGLIGCGWYGKCDLLRLIQVAPVSVVALCDVDKTMLEEACDIVARRQSSGLRPKPYEDYRTMLDNDNLDIALIATPDHWHALPMIHAVKSGADVFVQKPISVDITEGRAMVQAARKYGRVVQVGTQRRSTPHIAEAKRKYIDTGKLGKIGLVEIYCYYHMRARGNPPDQPAPENLNYDLWTGPAPLRPYNALVHPRRWRAFMEYGNGIVGDMCIHMLDMVRWMMGLGWPQRVSSQGGILVDKQSKANISDTQTASFQFENVNVVWQHRSWGKAPDPEYPWGATFYGDKGTLRASVHKYDFVPHSGGQNEHGDVVYELEEYPEDKTEKDLEKHVAPAIRSHMLDFLNAIQKRTKPIADIEEGHISTTSCILANLSMKLERSLQWDPTKNEIVGDEVANRLLSRPYRKPWEHPHPDNV